MSRYLEVGTFIGYWRGAFAEPASNCCAKGKPKDSPLRPELKFKLSRNQNTVQIIFTAREEACPRALEQSQKTPLTVK
jgi:hypothetical protein